MRRPYLQAVLPVFISLLVLTAVISLPASAQAPYLLKDINPSVDDGSAASKPDNMVVVGPQMYFLTDSAHGTELWRTDGDDYGTFMLKAVCSENCSRSLQRITNVNGTLFFVVRDSKGVVYLWKSDGTPSGTVLVKQFSGLLPGLFAKNNGVFFAFDDGVHGLELWTSDGTADGTTMVKDICPGTCSSSPASFALLNGSLFFSATDATNGTELWKSDGTADGTVLVKDICAGSCSSSPASLTLLGNTVVFSANDGVHGSELWQSDGTSDGTLLVADLVPGSVGSSPTSLTAPGPGVLHFASGTSVWEYTGSGTPRIVSTPTSGTPENVTDTTYGAIFYTVFYYGVNGPTAELWKYDYLSYTTRRIKQYVTMTPLRDLTVASSCVYVAGEDAQTSGSGVVLWKACGSSSSAMLVDVQTPYTLTYFNGRLHYVTNDSQLWSTTGSTLKALKVANATGSGLQFMVDFNGTAYFRASDGKTGQELWKTDGTANGTDLIKDINPGLNDSFPWAFADVYGTVFFRASDVAHGAELWKTDGTPAGTVMVKDICPGPYDSGILQPTNVNGTLLFSADDCSNGAELWRSDGTDAGTFMVKDLLPLTPPYLQSSTPRYLTNLNGLLLFAADSQSSTQLWKSDGTSDGTRIVKPLGDQGTVRLLTNVNGTVFFAGYSSNDSGWGAELWKTDGTEAGTVLVKDINPCSSSNPNNLTNVNGTLFFDANDGGGYQLWKSDGTAAGTVMVKAINPSGYSGPSPGSGPAYLTNVNGTLFFGANDVSGGFELWKSDGTEAGTTLVKDICPGTCTSNPTNLVNVNGTLYFSATDGVHGYELWKSDGTSEGTMMVADINPGSGDSSPSSLVYSNGKLLFSANDSIHGSELWAIDISPRIAVMKAPYPGTTLTSSTPTFNWSSVADASLYWIWIGTTPGGMELYNQGQDTNTSATISGLPSNGTTVYVRLFTLVNGAWLFNDYSYKAVTLLPAAITSPTPGSTLTGASVSFNWNAASGSTQYWMWIGTTPGGMELYNQGQGLNTSVTVNGLPTDGSAIYVRLFSVLGGAWQWNDYSFTAATALSKATMTSPANGATLTDSSVNFQWSAGTGATQYWMWIGTTPGGMELYNQGQGLNTSVTVNGLPTDGSAVYVRLFSVLNGAWQWNDYTYTAATAVSKATMTSPANGSALTGSSVNFTWAPGAGSTQYWMWIGTTAGGMELYNQGQGLNTSVTVNGLPMDGSTVYVRLFSVLNGAWQWNDYTYTAATAVSKATMTSPANGSALTGSSVNFTWSAGTGSTQYWMWIGTTAGGMELYNQGQGLNTSVTVNGLPTDGSTIYVRLFSVLNGAWQWNDYTYTASH